MKFPLAAFVCFATGLFAQALPAQVPTATAGFGNILYPGTGAPPAARQPFAKPIFTPGVAAARPANWRNVKPVASTRPRVIILPMYFPQPFYGFAPGVAEMPQAPAETPAAIYNPGFVPERPQPSMREYPEGSLPAPAAQPLAAVEDEKPTVYLIALKDSTVYSALAYWVEQDTLHYITLQHSPNRASIDLVDAELSAQLNRERGVEFKLPAR